MRRAKIYKMDKKMASETLKNVFEANHTEPNKVSLDTLVMRNMANTTLVKVCKWISIVSLILVIMAPMAFHNRENFNMENVASQSRVMVVEHQLYSDYFVMVLSGDTIDYAGIYCKQSDGKLVLPKSYNEETGNVVIPFESGTLNIYIPCTDGKVVQALLSK